MLQVYGGISFQRHCLCAAFCCLRSAAFVLQLTKYDLTRTQHVLTCADTRVLKWLWTVEWCLESACVTSLWHGPCSFPKTSTASSVSWSSQHLTSPPMLLPHSRYIFFFFFSFFVQNILTTSSYLTYLIFCSVSGSPHKAQNNVCRFPGEQLRQSEFSSVSCDCLLKDAVPHRLLTRLSGVHRVWEAPAFWQLCHQTAVFEGETSIILSSWEYCWELFGSCWAKIYGCIYCLLYSSSVNFFWIDTTSLWWQSTSVGQRT